MPTFTPQDVATISGGDPAVEAVTLVRWTKAKRIERLRRGLYALNEADRRVPLSPPQVAAALVEPSYLSGVWALANHSVIPESVFTLTSATKGRSVKFANSYGRFSYHRLPSHAWFGYGLKGAGAGKVLMADPEKALLDAIYWSRTAWTVDRFRQERVDPRRINLKRLELYVKKWPVSILVASKDAFIQFQEATCPIW